MLAIGLNIMRRVQPASVGQRGFTMPELLVVTAVIFSGVIASAFFLRPVSFEYENTLAERQTSAAHLVQMLTRFRADTGAWPEGLSAEPKKIGSENGMIDLCEKVIPKYSDDLPIDPVGGVKVIADGSGLADKACGNNSVYQSGYSAALSKDGRRVALSAPALPGFPSLNITSKLTE